MDKKTYSSGCRSMALAAPTIFSERLFYSLNLQIFFKTIQCLRFAPQIDEIQRHGPTTFNLLRDSCILCYFNP